jgi:hypothetical protein
VGEWEGRGAGVGARLYASRDVAARLPRGPACRNCQRDGRGGGGGTCAEKALEMANQRA